MKTIHYRDIASGDIYVARAMSNIKGSPLGNPFRIGRDGDRNQVIEAYRQWLWSQVKLGAGNPAYDELLRLVTLYRANPHLRLVCWCSPEQCHADVIIRAILWLDSSSPS